ncbi:MAG TPA: hypothetical protein VGX78_19210 [Pirellulales bacterium]|jgi:hypothetical protein|nr:hypothetical protein [Pirellulales bacterium]
MNAVDKMRSPLYRQLEAYEEAWKIDHTEALACRNWEDTFAVGVNIFHMLAGKLGKRSPVSIAWAPW